MLAFRQHVRLRAGQEQQANVEGVAKVQAVKGWRDHGGYAQAHQGRRRLLARRPDAEIRPGHQDVARLHLPCEFRADPLQAMPRNLVDAELHIGARRQRVGVDVGPHAPDAMGCGGLCGDGVCCDPVRHAITSRGSAMRPATAEAATV
ncbi:hypothetical protein D3C81_1756780 [compost metagenome]